MKDLRSIGLALVLILLCAPSAARADTLPKGTVVLAKTSPDALLIWDASPELADMIAAKQPDDQILKTLEADALTILAERAKSLSSGNIALRVVYQRSGAVSPAYGAPTFAGVERLFIMEAKRTDVAPQESAWRSALQSGSTAHGLTVTMTGKLPPPG